MVAKSDEKKEYAACVFIKWLTASEQNMNFVANTGYLPVTKQAFEDDLGTHMDTVEDPRIKKMLTSVLAMYEDYSFFTAPTYADFDSDSDNYEKDFKELLSDNRTEYLAGNMISAADALKDFKN
ncbi:MAG: extracellular solute-binding protein [Oscillospiraceae bacterium]|nr:extracellular solute-binding protein [Oscillospiraceae bacterium]